MEENTQSGLTAEEIWRRYRLGTDHHNQQGLYEWAARAHRFYEGDQWYGIEHNGELPVFNFIAPTVKYKTAMVSRQMMQIVYSPQDAGIPEAAQVCEDLNAYARRYWERQKLDALSWRIVRDACIAGESFLYFYNGELDAAVLDNTAVYFADEQQADLQKQTYILIYERRPVSEVRRDAERNGLPEETIAQILPDKADDADRVPETVRTGEPDSETCGSVVYFTRNADGMVTVTRATRDVVYQPETVITGLKRYPIAAYVWTPKNRSARGVGEVRPLIANQIEVNRLLARRIISAKLNAFAKPVYVKNMIENPEDIDAVGRGIEVKSGSVGDVRDVFSYIAPAPMSGEASLLQNELISLSRGLAGAGESALGEVNPERASGAAIIAVQDQAAIPLNEQAAAFRQFVEDIALIWVDLWRAYHPNGLVVDVPLGEGLVRRDVIPPELLERAVLQVKIDASPTNPFSKFAREQAIENARRNGDITFEEYVEALPVDATAPKAAFAEILRRRTMAAVGGGEEMLSGGAMHG